MRIKCPQYIRSEVILLAFSSDGTFLATACKDRAIWIWDLSKGDFEKPLNFNAGMKYHNGLITSMMFSPQEPHQLLTAGNDSTLIVFTKPTEGKAENFKLEHAFPGLIRKAMFIGQDKIA